MIRMSAHDAEKALARAGESVVTRDSKPVARVLPYASPRRRKERRFDPNEHGRWLRGFWRRRAPRVTTDEWLKRDRADHPARPA